MSTIACHTCAGTGKVGPVHVHREDGNHHWLDEMQCRDCDGTGRWTLSRLEAWRSGQEARQQRIARGESLREAAARLGIKSSVLSDIEHGRAAKEGR